MTPRSRPWALTLHLLGRRSRRALGGGEPMTDDMTRGAWHALWAIIAIQAAIITIALVVLW